MVDPAFTVLGVVVIFLVMTEVVLTAMHQGPGRLTRFVSNRLWKISLTLSKPAGRKRHYLLSLLGIGIVMFLAASLVLLLWGGWFLVFCADEQAVLSSTSGAPATLGDRFYFAGMTVFTLGTGDFVAGSSGWRIVMALSSFTGLFFVTFTITYLLPVVQAATNKRQLALRLFVLGETPGAIIEAFWDEEGFLRLEQTIQRLTEELAVLQQQSLTYPIVHFLHERTYPEAISLRLAVLDELVALLRCGLTTKGPAPRGLAAMDTILGTFLESLKMMALEPHPEPPAIPSLSELQRHGIPTVDVQTWEHAMQSRQRRRRMLRAFVERDGWRWADVYRRPKA